MLQLVAMGEIDYPELLDILEMLEETTYMAVDEDLEMSDVQDEHYGDDLDVEMADCDYEGDTLMIDAA